MRIPPGDRKPAAAARESAVDTVECPGCGAQVEIGEALEKSIRARLEAREKSMRARLEARDAARAQEAERRISELERGIRRRERELAERESGVEDLVAAQVAAQVDERLGERVKAASAEALERARGELAAELEAKEQRLAKAEAEVRERKRAELDLLDKMQEVEKAREDVELTVKRKLAEERARIREATKAEGAEERALELAQHETRIASLVKTIEELRKKAAQGSQQLQGEALEVRLEDVLREAFPEDAFDPVPKGFRGADLIQRVGGAAGGAVGTILWEAKHTKHWSDQWLPKLRDDQRALKAEVAVIVSAVLPSGCTPPTQVEGVWVAGHATAVGLAQALRQGLVQVAAAKRSLVGQQDKMRMLYAYLSGPEFRNRIEGLLEPFRAMRDDLEKEKRAVTRQWAKREKQIERAMTSTAGLWGDLEGIAEGALPALEAFELPGALPEGDPP
jgi:hypothetical protein